MTELSFLIDLLVNHKLPKLTKDAVIARIKEVECRTSSYSSSGALASQRSFPQQPSSLPPHIASQSPSTQAAMLRQMNSPAVATELVAPPRPDEAAHIQADAPQPVAIVAQTPQTAAAMAQRQQAIAASINGVVDKKTGRPRKW